MALERTFAIIKPDAVSRGQQGEILKRIHKAGFKIIAIKSMRLTKEEAGGFYAVHRERPFFPELTDFMSSGKIFAPHLTLSWGRGLPRPSRRRSEKQRRSKASRFRQRFYPRLYLVTSLLHFL